MLHFRFGVTKESIVLPPDTEYEIPDSVLNGLESDQDVATRVRSMQDLTEIVKSQKLQANIYILSIDNYEKSNFLLNYCNTVITSYQIGVFTFSFPL
jgi:hypothetical protein